MTGGGPAAATVRVAVVGAGPRGLSVCERLIANARAAAGRIGTTAATHSASCPVPDLVIDLIDPYPPGAGRVWRTGQAAELLMNTTIGDQTVFPDGTCTGLAPGLGPDMGTWWRSRADVECAPGRPAAHTAAECATVFPSRRLYGAYLDDAFQLVREAAEAAPGVTLRVHRAQATDIVEPDHAQDRQLLRLSDGTTLEVTDVVLCLGHIPTAPGSERASFAEFAQHAGLDYVPPGLPAEADLDGLLPGEPVAFRGFGLNFFDLMARLTHGRGGSFQPAGDELVYRASGAEPILVPGSRRGTPYRCKPVTAEHGMPDYRLRFFTAEAAGIPTQTGPLRFNEHLWPLILADLRLAWYTAMRRSAPAALTCSAEAMERAIATAAGLEPGLSNSAGPVHGRTAAEVRGAWEAFEARAVPEPTNRLDLARLARPLEGREFTTREAGASAAEGQSLHDAMLAFLREDLRDSLLGCELAPSKAVFAVLWAARTLLKEIVADGRLAPDSFATEVRGWFEDLVAGLCDGPPPQRYAELIALAEAGLARFAGPRMQVRRSPAGAPAGFLVSSPAVPGEVRARALVDAASPANNVRRAADGLVSGLVERGRLSAAEVRSGATLIPGTGLRVAGPAHHTVDSLGREHPHRFVLSIQLSDVQLGLAIAANPGTDARTLRDADTIAREILGITGVSATAD
ncbi:FAD/NAD(P)-binding protein [Brevibacterium sp. 50QC2O2]|uniref:FAD/NAD(P)-binding protein n=1 Tax=Brevibacterium sp. 50QC2O2 TaxID=2968459 RepID=UPI00211BD0CD|nr:FAD/NAD(P)-binding protein [Brevibacterium sp. 50QC2O2]